MVTHCHLVTVPENVYLCMTLAVSYEEEDTCASYEEEESCVPICHMNVYLPRPHEHQGYVHSTLRLTLALYYSHIRTHDVTTDTRSLLLILCVSLLLILCVPARDYRGPTKTPVCVCVCVCCVYILYIYLYIYYTYTYVHSGPACRHSCRVTVAAGGHDDGHSV